MTYNIFRKRHDDPAERRWNNRRDLVVENISRVSPDVFGLQEDLRTQIDYIQSQLPEYGWYGVGRDDGKSAGEHAAIFYLKDRFNIDAEGTFWFSNTPDTPSIGGSEWGNPKVKRISSWVRLVETNTGKSFYFFNLHLESEPSGQHSRERSVVLLGKKIEDRAHPEDPVIIAGDFNMLPKNAAMRYLIATLGYGDDYTALEEISDDEYTYQSWGSGSRYRLDYILSSPDTLWARSAVHYWSGSDHYPVVTELLL
ncbi:MAG: endonuclease/exonuclease/phosphatase family protein, partial [Anaerolineales bacterium]